MRSDILAGSAVSLVVRETVGTAAAAAVVAVAVVAGAAVASSTMDYWLKKCVEILEIHRN